MEVKVNVEAWPQYDKDFLVQWGGFIPYWVAEFEEGSLIDHLAERYGFGDLRSMGGTVADGVYRYPDDDDLPHILSMETPLGTLYQFPYGIVAIPDGEGKPHLVTRMD
jgi:hypothetical protein